MASMTATSFTGTALRPSLSRCVAKRCPGPMRRAARGRAKSARRLSTAEHCTLGQLRRLKVGQQSTCSLGLECTTACAELFVSANFVRIVHWAPCSNKLCGWSDPHGLWSGSDVLFLKGRILILICIVAH